MSVSEVMDEEGAQRQILAVFKCNMKIFKECSDIPFKRILIRVVHISLGKIVMSPAYGLYRDLKCEFP